MTVIPIIRWFTFCFWSHHLYFYRYKSPTCFLVVLTSPLFAAYNLFYWEKLIVLVEPHLCVSYNTGTRKNQHFLPALALKPIGSNYLLPREISIWFLSHERNPLLIGHRRGLHYRAYWERFCMAQLVGNHW